jgi:hypothetical protein
MRKRMVTMVGLVALATCSFAATNIKTIDWGVTPPDGTAQINVVPEVIDLTNPFANVTYMGLEWGTRPGIFQFDVQHDYDAGFNRMYMLCVQLEEGVDNSLYGYKNLSGYVGLLTSKIGDIVNNPDPGHIKAAALALTTWELNYDGYDTGSMTVNTGNLDLLNGNIKYLQSVGESAANYNAILAQANIYISELQALSTNDALMMKYRYYENPIGGDQRGAQDYVTGDVPGPVAFLPFLAGVVVAFRRRKR